MDAVLKVDLELRVLARADEFVDTRRAIPGRGAGVFGQVHVHRDRRVQQFQVRGLAFFVVGKGKRDVGQAVERQFAIRLRIGDRRVLVGFFGRFGVGFTVAKRAQQAEAHRIRPHVKAANRQRREQAILGPQRFDVADFFQVFADGAGFQLFVVIGQRVAGPACLDRVMGGLCCVDAGQHGVVVTLNAGHVHKASRAAKQRAAGECGLRDRLETAFGNRARAIGDAFAAF